MLLGAAHMSGAETFRVTTGTDDGAGSLRQAIISSNANSQPDTIDIDPSVREIRLFSTIDITGNVVVNGRGTTILGSRVTRLFSISGGEVRFDRLTFTGGYPLSENGGAFYIDSTRGKADFVNCTFFNNSAGGSGGAVYVYGSGNNPTTFTNCTLTNNEAAQSGGGVAIFGGSVQFTASIVTGNRAQADADVHVDALGILQNSGWYNVVGQTNMSNSFLSQAGNFVAVSPSAVFKTPDKLTVVDGVQVIPLLSVTANCALDLISADRAIGLNLPAVDERGASRPQMIAIDAGACELSPVALVGVDLVGGGYVQRSSSEQYSTLPSPAGATLDVRNYQDGIEWTVANPPSGEVISVDRFGNVTGLATGQATLRATAHGWNANGAATTATVTKSITVGEQPLPVPTVSATFDRPKDELSANSEQTLKLNLNIEPKDTPYSVQFESSEPAAATVTRLNSAGTAALVRALAPGTTTIRATVTAWNSQGTVSATAELYLTVTERKSRSGGGGGGCNGGFGIASLVLAGVSVLKGKKK